ncbi:sphingomyelin phosphodiesterase 4 isoform X2 [Aplysia californica]|uniref:Sphingomyelin phosphodiesterase 4 isoform X2 n=1 Tax=Aplysia californica TaxID=6500 RepID=A0ABM1AFN6_APLCA|nr:sphingomyelin phosphodiesterase 4 isoform X2 [Aplysia californica]
MSAYSATAVMERLNAAQGRPLLYQCSLLEEILATTSTKELRMAFPQILRELFDFELETTTGWQLDRVFQGAQPELFERLQRLLGPEGPLMKLVNSLHADPQAVYQFPFKCLPAPARQMLEEGVVPSFYANKLQGHNFSSPAIVLNAFELYIFHLAYALVCPVWQARNQGWSDLYEFLYPRIIDEYLTYFLPCDKSSLPSVPFTNNVVRSPLGSISPSRQYGSPSAQFTSPNGSPGGSSRSLFKPSFLQAQKQNQQSIPVYDQAETEIWRSETFLQVITEFWLNQNSFSGSEVMSFGGGLQEHFMPTMNQVKVVRLLVKYLHYFANSATSVVSSPFQSVVQSPLDQFKRSVIPHILQKKLYTFLRHAFDRWPLDSCFRMVLETWLSYIQPWRYLDFSRRLCPDTQPSDSEQGKQVDDKWCEFVEDNLLFYTVLTVEFLPRVHRMDLTSAYSAYMVYRVSRILNLPNLPNLIFKAEQELFGPMSRPVDLGGSYLSGHALQVSAIAPPSQLIELEGPNFMYMPFFSDAMKYNMMRIVEQLTESLDIVRKKQSASVADGRAQKNVGFFASLFGAGGSGESDYNTLAEQKRLPGHLEHAIHNFCGVFSLPRPSSVSVPPNASIADESLYLAEESGGLPECVETENGLKLTDVGRRQLLNKERKFDKFDMGDPDLEPVRSYENRTLVRLLFHICVVINFYFRANFSHLFQRQDFWGRFARVYLSPPLSIKPSRIRSPRTVQASKLLPSDQPRLSLRYLASYHHLLQLALVYVLQTFFLGLGPSGFVLLSVLLLVLYGLFVATLKSFSHSQPPHHRSSPTATGEIS